MYPYRGRRPRAVKTDGATKTRARDIADSAWRGRGLRFGFCLEWIVERYPIEVTLRQEYKCELSRGVGGMVQPEESEALEAFCRALHLIGCSLCFCVAAGGMKVAYCVLFESACNKSPIGPLWPALLACAERGRKSLDGSLDLVASHANRWTQGRAGKSCLLLGKGVLLWAVLNVSYKCTKEAFTILVSDDERYLLKPVR